MKTLYTMFFENENIVADVFRFYTANPYCFEKRCPRCFSKMKTLCTTFLVNEHVVYDVFEHGNVEYDVFQ